MNKTVFIGFFCISFLLSCNSQNVNTLENIKEISLGMSAEKFNDLFPKLETDPDESDFQTGLEEEVFGLPCGWSFNFKEGKLEWFMMNSYCDDINESNFREYSDAYDKFKNELENVFGKPVEAIDHETEFKDPFVERHWGYDVKEALWKTSDMKFQLIFTFMGGKGEYHFLLKAEFQAPDYEYF
jgi:hypothetical protein